MSQAHLFALHSSQLPKNAPCDGDLIHFADQGLQGRITHILRLRAGEQVQLFNEEYNMVLSIDEGTMTNKRGKISGLVTICSPHTPVSPELAIFVGLTKREAFEEMLYASAQMGITTITPLLTERVHKAWIAEKDSARFAKIMIAGCEQAKQFVIPQIKTPLTLQQALAIKHTGYSFMCDPTGSSLLQAIQHAAARPQNMRLFIGAEAGFSPSEEDLLRKADGITPLSLGKSILRSQDALRLIAGALRSLSS
jgi:16S rRNA (uracil1498-N3)-methyltransferase